MVATIQVLSGGAGASVNYFLPELDESSTMEYYADERGGEWYGRGAKLLSLFGDVDRSAFEQLLAGNSPLGDPLERVSSSRRKNHTQDSSQSATPHKGKDRCPGYDLTFSAPKSVSILWFASSTKVRGKIERCVNRAAKSTLQTLEELVPLARRGRGGLEREAAHLISALFMHTLSRDLDPQLHIHCVLPNICRGADGKWSGVHSRLLHEWTPALGRVFRANLASELARELGIRTYRPLGPSNKAESWFEVEGISKDLIREFSSRRKAIEKELAKRGIAPEKSTAHEREAANLATRKRKGKRPTLRELQAGWRAIAKKFGLTPALARSVLGLPPRTTSQNAYGQAWAAALKEITRQESHFRSQDVVQRVCEELQASGISGSDLTRKVLHDLESSPDIVRLADAAGQPRFTTKAMWELEGQLLGQIASLQARKGAIVPEKIVQGVLASHPEMSKEQSAAARHLMTQSGAIRILTGVAGAGKSFGFRCVREGFEKAGYTVLGSALAGAAKEELARQTGIESRTIASYLSQLERSPSQIVKDRLTHDAAMLWRALLQKPTWTFSRLRIGPKHVIILDEAAMLDSRTLNRFVKQVRKAKATLILAGDSKQLSPIEAGGPFERIAKEVGRAYLGENKRQQRDEDRKAVKALRDGNAKRAISSYAERGLVDVAEDPSGAMDAIVNAWVRNGASKSPLDHMIFTQTRAEAKELNERCQAERLASQSVSASKCIRLGNDRFHVGDRVLFHIPYRIQGIENGYRGTVLGIDPWRKEMTIRLDNEPTAKSRARGMTRDVTIPINAFASAGISLGYAATTHKLQGQTVTKGYVLMAGRMTNREMAYVQATRARESTEFFVTREIAGKDLSDLVRTVQRSRAKNLAHDLKLRNSQVPAQPNHVTQQFI